MPIEVLLLATYGVFHYNSDFPTSSLATSSEMSFELDLLGLVNKRCQVCINVELHMTLFIGNLFLFVCHYISPTSSFLLNLPGNMSLHRFHTEAIVKCAVICWHWLTLQTIKSPILVLRLVTGTFEPNVTSYLAPNSIFRG